MNRSIPLFPKEKIVLKPKEQKLVKVEAPFIEEISSLACKDIRQANVKYDDVKFYMKLSDVRYNEQ